MKVRTEVGDIADLHLLIMKPAVVKAEMTESVESFTSFSAEPRIITSSMYVKAKTRVDVRIEARAERTSDWEVFCAM